LSGNPESSLVFSLVSGSLLRKVLEPPAPSRGTLSELKALAILITTRYHPLKTKAQRILCAFVFESLGS
jgi:hypothetical protein